MKGRLVWAAISLCSMLMGTVISPGYGQVPREAEDALASRAPSVICSTDAQAPSDAAIMLRYFQFNAGRCMADTAVDRTAAPRFTARPDAGHLSERTPERARRGVGQVGEGIAQCFARIQAFGHRCWQTALTIANVCNVLADSFIRLQRATAGFSSSEAQAATVPPATTPVPATRVAPAAPAPTPAPADSVADLERRAAQAGGLRYIWVNAHGRRIYAADTNYNPNRNGETTWRRIAPPR